MPIYEYRCTLCGREFEMIRPVQDEFKEVACPDCGKKKTEKVISLPSGSHGSCQACSLSGPSCSST